MWNRERSSIRIFANWGFMVRRRCSVKCLLWHVWHIFLVEGTIAIAVEKHYMDKTRSRMKTHRTRSGMSHMKSWVTVYYHHFIDLVSVSFRFQTLVIISSEFSITHNETAVLICWLPDSKYPEKAIPVWWCWHPVIRFSVPSRHFEFLSWCIDYELDVIEGYAAKTQPLTSSHIMVVVTVPLKAVLCTLVSCWHDYRKNAWNDFTSVKPPKIKPPDQLGWFGHFCFALTCVFAKPLKWTNESECAHTKRLCLLLVSLQLKIHTPDYLRLPVRHVIPSIACQAYP